jgi:hypothetical protein
MLCLIPRHALQNLIHHLSLSTYLHARAQSFSRWYLKVQYKQVEVQSNLRPTVSRPVCLDFRRPSGTGDQFYFLLESSFRQLRVCYFVKPSLTRGRVCNLLYNCFWALPEQSLLGRSPAELTAIFYCFIWDSPNLEGQVPVFISPRNRVAQLYPRSLGSFFFSSYDSQGSGGGILTRLHTGYHADMPRGDMLLYTNKGQDTKLLVLTCGPVHLRDSNPKKGIQLLSRLHYESWLYTKLSYIPVTGRGGLWDVKDPTLSRQSAHS